jgi:general secretion pathway protein A
MHADPVELREHLFGEVADPDRFYASPVHETVRAEILEALRAHRSLVLLTGEPGTGKTMVLRRVIRDLEASGGRVLRCDDPALLERMLATLARQSGVPDATTREAPGEESVATNPGRSGDVTVVAVDEAQHLGLPTLFRFRALAEAWAEAGRPLVVLLVGLPELTARLAHVDRRGWVPSLRRVLPRLPTSEVGPYVAYRMGGTRGHGGAEFTPDAIARIAAHAEGIPRVIDTLCDEALRVANQANGAAVSAPMVDEIARKLEAMFAAGHAARILRRLGHHRPRAVALWCEADRGITAVRRGAVAVSLGVAHGLTRARGRAAIVGSGVTRGLRAGGQAGVQLGHEVTRGLRAGGQAGVQLGHEVTRGLRAGGRAGVQVGYGVTRGLRAGGQAGVQLGHGVARGLRAAGVALEQLGHGVTRALGAAGRSTARAGRNLTDRLRASQPRRQPYTARARTWAAWTGIAALFLLTALPTLRQWSHLRSPLRPVAPPPETTELRGVPPSAQPVRPRPGPHAVAPPPPPRVAPRGARSASPEAGARPPELRARVSEPADAGPGSRPRPASSPVGGAGSGPERARLRPAEAGETRAVRGLPDSRTSPGVRNPRGRTSLMAAITRGDESMTELLLAWGVDVNARDDDGVTALMLAARDGDTALARRLLDRGAIVDARSRAGWTALTYAAWKGHPDVARRLLRAGADPTLTDRSGWSALMHASFRAAEIGTAEPSATVASLDTRELASVEAARRRYGETMNLLGAATRGGAASRPLASQNPPAQP